MIALKLGDRVKVAIKEPGSWVAGAVRTLNGQLGTISEVGPVVDPWGRPQAPTILVDFDAPVQPWHANALPVAAFHFEPDDLQVVG